MIRLIISRVERPPLSCPTSLSNWRWEQTLGRFCGGYYEKYHIWSFSGGYNKFQVMMLNNSLFSFSAFIYAKIVIRYMHVYIYIYRHI